MGRGRIRALKRTLLFVLALIAVGCADTEQPETPSEGSEQVTPSASCAALPIESPSLQDVRTCAEQGNARARELLGIRYAAGTGLPVDNVLAYMWLNLAAAQGQSAGAPVFRDLTAERMTREQIAEAQRLSREWLEAHPPSGN